ncbi:MAG TPA: hypothetical protein VG709_07170, partial [Actinomycetota bacterium]|nr:hypothetical protein [Actinomycetota bacterium]
MDELTTPKGLAEHLDDVQVVDVREPLRQYATTGFVGSRPSTRPAIRSCSGMWTSAQRILPASRSFGSRTSTTCT